MAIQQVKRWTNHYEATQYLQQKPLGPMAIQCMDAIEQECGVLCKDPDTRLRIRQIILSYLNKIKETLSGH